MRGVIDEVRHAYQLKAEGKSIIWPLVSYEFPGKQADMDIRSGYIRDDELHGLKMLNTFQRNKEKGIPILNGIMMMYSSETGTPLGIMDASYITCVRTGAAGALGVDILARKDATTLMLLGAGLQAAFQIAATLILRPMIRKVYIVNPVNHQKAEDFAANIGERLKCEFEVNVDEVMFIAEQSTETAVRNSDAIITVTPSRKPLIFKEWVRPGTHFSCIGADMETKQEIESAIFTGARIFADDIDQCGRVGEMEIPLIQGVIHKEDIAGEIGDLLVGNVEGRQSEDQITIFDATGLYILDLAAAKSVMSIAAKENLGSLVDIQK